MAFRRRTIWTRVALGIVLTISVPLTAAAQGDRNAPPPYTSAPDAKDLKAVLFNWTWHMGMLRGVDEHELVVSLEYQGNGTLRVNGQPCTLTKYRASTNYQAPGQRVQYTCTRPNGQTYSAIEVVSGQYAWNEDMPGAEIVPGQGKATPMPRAVQERLIRLWASPQGAPKAALAGAGVGLTAMDRSLGPLLDDGSAERVSERFTRQGDEILYEVTVEDPEVLVEPWVMTPRILRLNPDPNAGLLPERGNCEVYELEDITTQIRH